MTYLVKCYLKDHQTVLAEEKLSWITEILLYFKVPQEVIDLASSNLQEFANHMEDYGIEIDHFTSGEVNVYKKAKKKDKFGNYFWLPPTEKNLVAQWKAPKFVKVRDKEVYYEITIDEWSVLSTRK